MASPARPAAAPAPAAPAAPLDPEAAAALGPKGTASALADALVSGFYERVASYADLEVAPASPFVPEAAPLAAAPPARPKGEARPPRVPPAEWQCYANLVAAHPAPAKAAASVGRETRVALVLLLARAAAAAAAGGAGGGVPHLLAREAAAGGFVCRALDAFRRAYAAPLALDPVTRLGDHGVAVNRAVTSLAGAGPLCEPAGGLFLAFLKALGVLWADRATAAGKRIPFGASELRGTLAVAAAAMGEEDAAAVHRTIALLRADLPRWAATAAALRPARPPKADAPAGAGAPARPPAADGSGDEGSGGDATDEGSGAEEDAPPPPPAGPATRGRRAKA